MSVGHCQFHCQTNHINLQVISMAFPISHCQLHCHFCCFAESGRNFMIRFCARHFLIAKRKSLCYNIFVAAAWRNGRRTALKMRRETVSVQVRLPLLRLPGMIPGVFPLRQRGFRVCLEQLILSEAVCGACGPTAVRESDY